MSETPPSPPPAQPADPGALQEVRKGGVGHNPFVPGVLIAGPPGTPLQQPATIPVQQSAQTQPTPAQQAQSKGDSVPSQ